MSRPTAIVRDPPTSTPTPVGKSGLKAWPSARPSWPPRAGWWIGWSIETRLIPGLPTRCCQLPGRSGRAKLSLGQRINRAETGRGKSAFLLARDFHARPNIQSMLQSAQEGAAGASRPSGRSRKCVAAIFVATLGLLLFGLSSQARAQQLDDETCAQCHATDQNETDG